MYADQVGQYFNLRIPILSYKNGVTIP